MKRQRQATPSTDAFQTNPQRKRGKDLPTSLALGVVSGWDRYAKHHLNEQFPEKAKQTIRQQGAECKLISDNERQRCLATIGVGFFAELIRGGLFALGSSRILLWSFCRRFHSLFPWRW